MKKILQKAQYIFLAIIMCLSLNVIPIKANQDKSLYVYTDDTTYFDEYAQQKLSMFINAYYGQISATFELGKGIKIITENNNPQVFYPIWENNEIVAKLIVSNVDGVFSGTFSETQASQLNELTVLTSKSSPLMLIGDNGLYAKIGNDIYDLNGEIGEKSEIILNENIDEMLIINARDYIDYELSVSRRSSLYETKTLPWTKYAHQSDLSDGYCASYCLYNVLKNMGITTYSLQTIKNKIGLVLQQSNMHTFLNNNGFTYLVSKESGYLSTTKVKTGINNNHYIIMFVRNTIGETNSEGVLVYTGHTTVLYGYVIDPLLGNSYKVWDPYENKYLVIDADTRIINSDNAHVYRWNNGYVYNIEKK